MAKLPLWLHPLDVLLFRDGRPFSPGATARTQLPLPQTFTGAITTHITHHMKWSSRDWHGYHELPEENRPWHARLKFCGPWLFVHDPTALERACGLLCPQGPLLSTPADIVRLGNHKSGPLERLRPLHLEQTPVPGWTPAQEGLSPLWITQGEKPEAAPYLIYVIGLGQYLGGACPDREHLWNRERLVLSEERTGIGIDPERLTADQDRGLIYSASYLRLQPGVCFYGEVGLPDGCPGTPAPEELFPTYIPVAWGGEGRRVVLE